MTDKRATTKKQIAQEFLKLTEEGQVDVAFDLYVAKSFKHHNPRFKGDRDSLKLAMIKTAATFPDLEVKERTALEDGSRVAVHSHIKPNPKLKNEGLAYIHIFRFSNGKIVELWDFGHPVPPKSANENGMF